MASCTRIEGLLQAYLDGELPQSERVILEQHIAECPACNVTLHRQQRAAALLYEAFADGKLNHSLREQVMSNLPDLEMAEEADVNIINWRTKHVIEKRGKFAQRVPVAVAVVLAAIGLVLGYKWPHPEVTETTVGVVTHASGKVISFGKHSLTPKPVYVEDYVQQGHHFETDMGSQVMVSLAGPSTVKCNASTEIEIVNDRHVKIFEGEAWFQVGHDGRRFRVGTPAGYITVHGTAFAVKVDADETLVTVEEGEVSVENFDNDFMTCRAGEQVLLVSNGKPARPARTTIAQMTSWAQEIKGDRAALNLFEKNIQARSEVTVLTAKKAWIVSTSSEEESAWAISAIQIFWEADKMKAGHAGYDVYVYDGNYTPIFKDRIPGQVFDSDKSGVYEIAVPDEAIQGVRALAIHIERAGYGNSIETNFTTVQAKALNRN